MAKEDAEKVQKFLQQAGEASKPLKDAFLTKKINEAAEHISKKMDTKTG